MRWIKHMCCYIAAFLAAGQAYAQLPRFRDLPDQQYYMGTPITPLAPNFRPTSGPVPPYIYGQVTTFAGSGNAGLVNGKGKLASFNSPMDIKLDAAGNLYVADAGNNAIRKIAPDGTVITLAGSGAEGYADGAGTAAKFAYPTGLVLDAAGNLFVVDQQNQLIRKITPAGVVSVYAGTPGVAGMSNNIVNFPTGITIDKYGTLFITDTYNLRVRQLPGQYLSSFAGSGQGRGPGTGFDGPGEVARFGAISGITVGPDENFYVVDGEMVRKVNPSAVVSTYLGVNQSRGAFNGDAKTAVFQNLFGIAIAPVGTMYLSDMGNHIIRRYGVRENFVSWLAGNEGKTGPVDGVGSSALFNKPAGICLDDAGYLYVADSGNNLIRKVCTTGFQIFPALPPGLSFDATTGTISGTPTAPSPLTLYTIVGYNTEGQGQYSVSIQVNEFTRQPQSLTLAPIPVKKETDPDFLVNVTRSNPTLPYTLSTSDISIASIADGKVHILGPGTVYIYADQPGNPYYYDAPRATQQLVITEVPPVVVYPEIKPKANPVVIPLDETGNVTITPGQLADITPEHNLQKSISTVERNTYTCADVGLQSPVVTSSFGPDPFDPLSAQFNYPSNIVFDASSGKMYIPDKGNYRIRSIAADGRVGTLAGSGQPGKADGKAKVAGFSREVLTITTDAQGNVYVCDVGNALIRKIMPDGTVSTFAYEQLIAFNDFDPVYSTAVAVDKAGYVYVSDKTRIYKIAPDGGSAVVFAGSGKEQITDGTGAAADFNGISGLYFGANGDLYVSSFDPNDINTLRRVTPTGAVTTIYRKTDPLLHFTRLVVDSKGNAFIGSTEPKIYKITPDGTLSIFAGSASRIGAVDGDGPTVASFNNPQGIGIDPQDNLYIADQDNHRIRRITPGGIVSTIAGSGIAGYLDNTSYSNKTKKNIPIAITSPITINGKYDPVVIPYLDICPAIVADYTKAATAKSTCANAFTFTQTPAAGTVLSDGQTVNLVLTAHDNLSPYDDASVTFTITAKKLPTPTVVVSPGFIDTCERFPVKYTATAQNGGLNPVYIWYVNGVEKYRGGDEFTSSELATGDNITCKVTNNDGCAPITSAPSAAASIKAAPSVTTSVTIFASSTEPICPGSRLDFTAITQNVQPGPNSPRYQWQVNGNNVGGNSATFSTSNLANGDMVTCLMSSGGKCVINPVAKSNPFIARLLSDGDCAITIPNTFTPNGDGVNDYWQIPVLKNYPNSTVSIFNRNGTLLYQSTGYSKPWDGTYQGSALSAGTYYYTIDTHTFRSVLAGWVTILK
ncbi:T9SS type B sorting domain-containing protein [Mucilaginibacter psychrotolerans]|uniref:T9SS type B sorting domain-containing protein n=1 Tax=Mucilaginibacter psychrotolerans TaxID=1524096 RepID=A0A4Y8SLW8_9SPHI|nr:gliding motility-associated C-terminal domain-containing protein [Mucilaginibacter psychrotolerans]TFF40073.1 T9SS type B sorting domain-containing protein [Mucilaginibacter psychrotolerans]